MASSTSSPLPIGLTNSPDIEPLSVAPSRAGAYRLGHGNQPPSFFHAPPWHNPSRVVFRVFDPDSSPTAATQPAFLCLGAVGDEGKDRIVYRLVVGDGLDFEKSRKVKRGRTEENGNQSVNCGKRIGSRAVNLSFKKTREMMTMMALSNVVVIGIWGRAGGDGIPGLIKELSPRLEVLGVPATNIFSMSWNPNHNDDAFKSPDFESHRRAIGDRGGGAGNAYIAIIGHSYGGWAACLLSRNIKPQPRYVALIDPVFGPKGDLELIVEPMVNPHSGNVHNWYQRNSITEPTVIEDCTGVVVGCPGGVSCGRSIPGVNNHEVKWQFTWAGNRKRRNCPGGKKGRQSYHLNIDSDRFVWRQIIEKIEADVKAL